MKYGVGIMMMMLVMIKTIMCESLIDETIVISDERTASNISKLLCFQAQMLKNDACFNSNSTEKIQKFENKISDEKKVKGK